MTLRPRRTSVICNGGLAAASRVRVGGPRAIVIGYVCGSRLEFETIRGELPAVAYWHLLALIGTYWHLVGSTSDVSIVASFGLTTNRSGA